MEIERRKADYARDGVEVIVIPLKKLPIEVKEREEVLNDYVWE